MEVLLQNIKFSLEPVDNLRKQVRIIKYVRALGDRFKYQQGRFLHRQIHPIESLCRLQSYDLHQRLNNLNAHSVLHFPAAHLNHVLHEEQVPQHVFLRV